MPCIADFLHRIVRPNPDSRVLQQEVVAVTMVPKDAADSGADLAAESEVAWVPEVVKSTSPTFVTSSLSLSTCVEISY